MGRILNSSEDRTGYRTLLSSTRMGASLKTAISLKMYQPLHSTDCPLPAYLCVWRWFSSICMKFTILQFTILASPFFLALRTKPTPLWEVCAEVQKLIVNINLTKLNEAGTSAAKSSIICSDFKSKFEHSIATLVSDNETWSHPSKPR